MNWEVDDVEATVHDLEDRDVAFEDYDRPGLKTIDHIATIEGQKAAWFLDLDGNVLCLHHRSY